METSIRLPGPISLQILLAYGGLDPATLPDAKTGDDDADGKPGENGG